MDYSLEELKTLRRSLHQYPEVSGEEEHTAERIKLFLEKYAPDQLIEELGGYGFAAVYGGNKPGKNLLIRCELDALPITELNNIDYISKNEGVAHTCGHDGHSTIVAGLAALLSAKRPAKGSVILLFQPAEENGEGAKAVLRDIRFHKLKPDYVFALHNLPGYPKHQIILKRGVFTAAVNSMVVKLVGKTSHAGEPDKGINPALAISEIFVELNKLNNLDQESDNYRQVSFIHADMGEKAYGISAGEAELGFTFRCWSTKQRDALGDEMEDIVKRIAKKYGLRSDIDFIESFHANKNADEAVDLIAKAAENEGYEINWKTLPHRWGEDFGILTEAYTGALFGVGAGENTPALHNPDYDFPDEIIETGVKMFYQIINQVNN